MKVILFLVSLNFLCTYSMFANNHFVFANDTINNKIKLSPEKDSILNVPKKQVKVSDLKKPLVSKFRTFPQLDNFKKEKSFSYKFKNAEPEFTPQFITENFPINKEVDSLKNKAEALFKEIEDLQKFVDILTKDRLVEFPIGLKSKDTTGTNVTMAISEVQMHPNYAELKIFAKLSIPQQGIDLFFGAEGVKFSHDGAFIGDTKLVLLGDQPIAFNGDSWLLTLKGDSNMKTGAFGEKSFVTVNCNGIEEISLEADLRVSRNVLLPIDDQGNYMCGDSAKDQFKLDENKKPTTDLDTKCYVGTSFSVKASGWNDLLADINLPQFEVAGFKGWGFNIENAVLDLSDTRNSPNVKFPKIYETTYSGDNETLWRGVYASNVQVTLPKAFAKNGSERTTFGATDLLLDSNGVSGNFYGNNIIQKGEGSASKWPFTIDSLEIKMEVNKLKGGALSGTIQVPILDKPFSYEGTITTSEYNLTVITEEKITAPVFLAEMELEPNSNVSIKVTDEGVYPSANLTGSLTLKANADQTSAEETLGVPTVDVNGNLIYEQPEEADFNMPGITFEELKINTEPGLPKIEAEKFEYSGSNVAFNFPVNIDNVKLIAPDQNTAGLSFDLTINFDNQGSNASTKLAVLGKVEDQDNIETWKYDDVKIDAVAIDIDRSGVKIAGSLEVMKDDPTYGSGFAGEVNVDITKVNIQANAKAMFGNKDFRYWFVDVWTENASGGDTKLGIKKFVGGLSYAMKKTTGSSSNWTPSESVYIPYEENGLSLKAGIDLAIKSSFKGKAFLEMDYNRNGGLNRINFIGEGALMVKNDTSESVGPQGATKGKLVELGDKIQDYLDKNEDAAKELAKSGNNLGVAKESIDKDEVAKEGSIGVFVGIEKDFTTDTFHGEFEVYVDLHQLKGASDKQNSSNTLAGRAVIHTSPDKWYLHVGTPETPISLAFMVGPETFTVNGYFMTGSVMPTQLKPHYRVLQILGDDIMDANRSTSELTAGNGFAFGLGFEYKKDFKASIFYAFFEAAIGFDVMHREYPDTYCVGSSEPIGNDGWYSLGQVYAYLYGEAGVRIKLFGSTKKFKVLEAGVAALLRGQFPNPSYFEGYVGAYYSVLGGLIKGKMRLHVEYGEECVIQRSADDGLEVPIIADIYPKDDDTDIDVFVRPQITFNYAINRQVTITESTGDKRYKIVLEEAKLLSDGVEIPTELNWDSTQTEVTFDLMHQSLPSEADVTVQAKVTFQEYVSGSWQTVTSGGQTVNETKEVTFHTSKAPDYIPLHNIDYMYPIKDQKYFFVEEYNQGYIQLDITQDYLFDPSYIYKAQFESEFGEITRTELTYNIAERRIYYNLPEANTSTSYQFDVMVFPKTGDIPDYVEASTEDVLIDNEDSGQDLSFFEEASDSQISGGTNATASLNNKSATRVINPGESKSLLDYNFSTSMYATFNDKMESLEAANYLTEIKSSDVDHIQINQIDYEPFELIDLVGGNYTLQTPLIKGYPVLRDSYYKQVIKPISYDFANDPISTGFTLSPAEDYEFLVDTYYVNYLNNQPDANYLKNKFPFIYNMVTKYHTDFLSTRNYIVNVFDKNEDPEYYNTYGDIADRYFPTIPFGTYKSRFTYTLPGGIHTNNYQIIDYIND